MCGRWQRGPPCGTLAESWMCAALAGWLAVSSESLAAARPGNLPRSAPLPLFPSAPPPPSAPLPLHPCPTPARYVVNAAMSNDTGLVQFPRDCVDELCSLDGQSDGKKPKNHDFVALMTVDYFLKKYGVPRVDVLKVRRREAEEGGGDGGGGGEGGDGGVGGAGPGLFRAGRRRRWGPGAGQGRAGAESLSRNCPWNPTTPAPAPRTYHSTRRLTPRALTRP